MEAAWLVAPKIARINIRARRCHSVNFPRCWLYRVKREEGVTRTGRTRGVLGGSRGWIGGKSTDIPIPRWNFMRFAPTPLLSHPYASSRWSESNAHMGTWSLRMNELKKKKITRTTVRVTSTTGMNNAGLVLVNELSRQKLQLLRTWSEPRQWIVVVARRHEIWAKIDARRKLLSTVYNFSSTFLFKFVICGDDYWRGELIAGRILYTGFRQYCYKYWTR